eukprot:365327-Chlamydomonas_euryale.AAC.3
MTGNTLRGSCSVTGCMCTDGISATSSVVSARANCHAKGKGAIHSPPSLDGTNVRSATCAYLCVAHARISAAVKQHAHHLNMAAHCGPVQCGVVALA